MTKLNLSKMAIQELDLYDLTKEFKRICQEQSSDSEAIYVFLNKVIPVYEATKRKLCADAIEAGSRELIDWIWEDPMNPTPYSRLQALKKIADELLITLDNNGRTN